MAKKMGRPLKGESKRDKRVTIRLTEDEFAFVDEVSTKVGLSKTETILTAVELLNTSLEE
ncbi:MULTISPECIES: CopG family transcriptional regulator [Streptococcus]|uniref:CopG family transcriptional regulator n=1 Tax=Streptococcus TaxID=1301 RepID=UPI00110C3CA4|nr:MULTISPECIES: CopG family transcriptional regulator [Streptococcus]MBW8107270.1 CopG family transcriptional regulator [Streptococcus pseudopneumoniae]TMR62940.1 CopG family transcriptional regulator [Streptococcus pseudopneumoniae]TMR83705.1 CopG family transcriptional regulator [Streptococcus pseudopneumoniae]